jgi:hypothetical protein
VAEDRLRLEYLDKTQATSRKEANVGVTQVLRDYGVTPTQLDEVSIVVVDPSQFGNWVQFLFYSVFPWAVFIGVFLRLNRVLGRLENELGALRADIALNRTQASEPSTEG